MENEEKSKCVNFKRKRTLVNCRGRLFVSCFALSIHNTEKRKVKNSLIFRFGVESYAWFEELAAGFERDF